MTYDIREIALRVACEKAMMFGKDEIISFSAALFAEFQKLRDSRIAELESKWFELQEYCDSVVETRNELAAKLKALEEQKPVAWAYTINKSHSVFSAECPPDDAYDEGTLYPLYAAPVALSVPEGYALVPIEPTEAILDALYSKADLHDGDLTLMWKAAIAQGAKP